MYCSLAGLKRKLAEAKSRRASTASEAADGITHGSGITPGIHIEADRFLTEEDFERIK